MSHCSHPARSGGEAPGSLSPPTAEDCQIRQIVARSSTSKNANESRALIDGTDHGRGKPDGRPGYATLPLVHLECEIMP
jgi:hypothetical protein